MIGVQVGAPYLGWAAGFEESAGGSSQLEMVVGDGEGHWTFPE